MPELPPCDQIVGSLYIQPNELLESTFTAANRITVKVNLRRGFFDVQVVIK